MNPDPTPPTTEPVLNADKALAGEASRETEPAPETSTLSALARAAPPIVDPEYLAQRARRAKLFDLACDYLEKVIVGDFPANDHAKLRAEAALSIVNRGGY